MVTRLPTNHSSGSPTATAEFKRWGTGHIMNDLLDRASNIAFSHLDAAGGDFNKLSMADQTVILIYTAQGVIDNGGFQYFFESDFPGNPPYSIFSAAYSRIGANVAASNIERAVRLFPIENPHLFSEKRNRFLDTLEESSELITLGDELCGDASIWENLEKFVRANAAEFEEGRN